MKLNIGNKLGLAIPLILFAGTPSSAGILNRQAMSSFSSMTASTTMNVMSSSSSAVGGATTSIIPPTGGNTTSGETPSGTTVGPTGDSGSLSPPLLMVEVFAVVVGAVGMVLL